MTQLPFAKNRQLGAEVLNFKHFKYTAINYYKKSLKHLVYFKDFLLEMN